MLGSTHTCIRGLLFATLAAIFCLGFTETVEAQDIPDAVAPPTTTAVEGGTTEANFEEAPALKDEATPEAEPEKEKPKAEVEWMLSAGGSFNTGNTEAWTLNAGTSFKLVKTDHQLTAGALFNFGRANIQGDTPDLGYQTTVKKFLFNTRYDYFMTDMDAVWASIAERWDPLAGFDTQLMAQAGYLRAFIKEENHYFAGRIGYSYTYENFSSFSALAANSNNIHGLLAALDYENKLNEHVTLLSNIVTIYNLARIDEQNADPFQDIRIFYNLALLASMTDKLAFEVRFLLLYDRLPPTPEKTDTTTLFSLVYTLL